MDDSRTAFSRRLNEAFDRLGVPEKQKGRYTALAKLFSVTPVAARDWCEGTSYPSLDKLMQILDTTRASADWLLLGRGGSDERLVRPRRLDLGEPGGAESTEVAFDRGWLLGRFGTDRLALIAVSSDAMEPTLARGERVLVDPACDSISDSGLYAFTFSDGSDPAVRRVARQLDGALDVLCDNPAYRSQALRVTTDGGILRDARGEALPVTLAGRVVLHLRDHPG